MRVISGGPRTADWRDRLASEPHFRFWAIIIVPVLKDGRDARPDRVIPSYSHCLCQLL